MGLDKRRLVPAMVDPGNCRATDNISFAARARHTPGGRPRCCELGEPAEALRGRAGSPLHRDLLGGAEQEAELEEWEMGRYRRTKKVPAAADPAPLEEAAGSPSGLAQICQAMSELPNREDLADPVAAYLSFQFGRGAVFLLRKGHARGWRAAIDRRKAPAFEGLRIRIASI